jgi:hypothetical protein
MYDIADVPSIPDRDERLDKVTADCYGQAEELAAMEVYFTDAMQFPFAASWRDPDEPSHTEPVTVLGVHEVDERRGVLLRVKRGDKERRLPADVIWADDEDSTNAVILGDYRYWVDELYGLTPGYE